MLKELNKIFTNDIKPKRFYSIHFPIKNLKELFNKILFIYKYGMIHLFGKDGKYDIMKLDDNKVIMLKQYMNSIGIEPIIKSYNLNYMDSFYNKFKYDVKKKFPSIKFITTRFNDKIKSLNFTINKNEYDKLKKYVLQSDYKQECIDLINLNFEKNKLIDYKYTVDMNVIFFVLRFNIFINYVLI